MFCPALDEAEANWTEYRMSRRTDHVTIRQLLSPYNPTISGYANVYTAYKRKDRKVRPVDYGGALDASVGGDPKWRERAIARERPPLVPGKFDKWLTPKFSDIPRGARLTEERIGTLDIGSDLWPCERQVLIELLYNREAAISFDFKEMGKVRHEVAPPSRIRTVEHKAWQAKNFPIPRALEGEVVKMIGERLGYGVLEYCQSPYRNAWFLVAKSTPGKYRLINAAVLFNAVTIRDANLPPSVDAFSEDFAGCQLSSLVDFFSGYDQCELHAESRPLTAFQTPVHGLVQNTTLPMGATNSVAQFVRITGTITAAHVPQKARVFLDDIGIKGPRSRYNEREVAPGIRQFVLEHLQNLDGVLADIERAGCTIGPKSKFCASGLNLVGFVCDGDGRHPESRKVIKILEWKPCASVAEARAFMGLCVYYRIWIEHFSLVAGPIYTLFQKDVEFQWGTEEQLAMDKLKVALTTAPALVKIDYDVDLTVFAIILAVDSSLSGWGAVLMQLDEKKKRHPARYESGLWDSAERNYDATKRECRGVLKAIKKMRFHLYGIHFILETDAQVLVDQLNRSASDIPGALVLRWIAWMRLFDFEVRHVPGKKHTAADGLSRRPRTESDDIDDTREVNIDEWIDGQLNLVTVYRLEGEQSIEEVMQDSYTNEHLKYAEYLLTLARPEGMPIPEFRAFKKRALKFQVSDNLLWRRATNIKPMLRVVDKKEDRKTILRIMHDEMGHRSTEAFHARLATKYWWDTSYRDCKTYYKTCKGCQQRSSIRTQDPLHPTWVSCMWEKIGLDIVYMPPCMGKNFLVLARDDLSGYPEGRALAKANSVSVMLFIWEDCICRHGIFGRMVVDGGPENRGLVLELAKLLELKRVQISAYNAQAAGKIEGGHKPIVKALSIETEGGVKKWVPRLPGILLAERTSVNQATGRTPFWLEHGYEATLPVELQFPTWRVLNWHGVKSRADLLLLREKQIQARDQDLEGTVARYRRKRQEAKEWTDDHRRLRKEPIPVGRLVLVWDERRYINMSVDAKLQYRWIGPFRVSSVVPAKSIYTLEEFDGTPLKGTYAGSRLKPFYRVGDQYETDDEGSEDVGPTETTRHQDDQNLFHPPGGGIVPTALVSQGTTPLSGGDEDTDTGAFGSPQDVQNLLEGAHEAIEESLKAGESGDQGLAKTRTQTAAIKRQKTRDHNQQNIPEGQRFAVVISRK